MTINTPRSHGFTLIEICMALILLGILAAVAVPKFFDLQDKSHQRAASAAVAEAQARINAYFGDQLLSGKSCLEAVRAVNEDLAKDEGGVISDAGGRIFGDYKLQFASLQPDGTASPVTVFYGGRQLGTGPIGQLTIASCSGAVGSGPGSLKLLFGTRFEGTANNCGSSGTGVIGSVIQSNCKGNEKQTLALQAQAAKLVSSLIPSLGDPFTEESVKYWRILSHGEDRSLVWTTEQVNGITANGRVPFIQAREVNGEMTYYVGLAGTITNFGGSMLIQDGNGQNSGKLWSETVESGALNNYHGHAGRYVTTAADGSYVYSSSRPNSGFSDYQEAVRVYRQLTAIYQGNDALKTGTIDNGTAVFSGSVP